MNFWLRLPYEPEKVKQKVDRLVGDPLLGNSTADTDRHPTSCGPPLFWFYEDREKGFRSKNDHDWWFSKLNLSKGLYWQATLNKGSPLKKNCLNTGIAGLEEGGWGVQPLPKCFWSTFLWSSIVGQNAKGGVG